MMMQKAPTTRSLYLYILSLNCPCSFFSLILYHTPPPPSFGNITRGVFPFPSQPGQFRSHLVSQSDVHLLGESLFGFVSWVASQHSVYSEIIYLPCCNSTRPTATVTMVTHHSQSNVGRKGFIRFTLPHQSSTSKFHIRTGTQNREGTWRQEPDAKAMEGCCSLACFSYQFSLLSYRTQGHQPRASTTYNRLNPHPLISNCQNALQLISWPFFSDDSSLCQFDRKSKPVCIYLFIHSFILYVLFLQRILIQTCSVTEDCITHNPSHCSLD